MTICLGFSIAIVSSFPPPAPPSLASRMSSLCFKKCVVKMSGESDLNVGEMSCVDRCVSKYMEAQEKVGQKPEDHSHANAYHIPIYACAVLVADTLSRLSLVRSAGGRALLPKGAVPLPRLCRSPPR